MPGYKGNAEYNSILGFTTSLDNNVYSPGQDMLSVSSVSFLSCSNDAPFIKVTGRITELNGNPLTPITEIYSGTPIGEAGSGGAIVGHFSAPWNQGSYLLITEATGVDSSSDRARFVTPFKVIDSTALAPTVSVYAQNVDIPSSKKSNPLTVPRNTRVKVSWESRNANTCSCTYYKDAVNPNADCGSGIGLNVVAKDTYTLTESKTFNVTCSN